MWLWGSNPVGDVHAASRHETVESVNSGTQDVEKTAVEASASVPRKAPTTQKPEMKNQPVRRPIVAPNLPQKRSRRTKPPVQAQTNLQRQSVNDGEDHTNDRWMDHNLQKLVMYAINHAGDAHNTDPGISLKKIKSIAEITPDLVSQLRWIDSADYQAAENEPDVVLTHDSDGITEQTRVVEGIRSLRGLEKATQLRHLDIQPYDGVEQKGTGQDDNDVDLSGNLRDISAIQHLQHLTSLNFQSNQIQDISALRQFNVTKETEVFLAGNCVTDFSPLHRLQQVHPDGVHLGVQYVYVYGYDNLRFPSQDVITVPLPKGTDLDGRPLKFKTVTWLTALSWDSVTKPATGTNSWVTNGQLKWTNAPKTDEDTYGGLGAEGHGAGVEGDQTPLVDYIYYYKTDTHFSTLAVNFEDRNHRAIRQGVVLSGKRGEVLYPLHSDIVTNALAELTRDGKYVLGKEISKDSGITMGTQPSYVTLPLDSLVTGKAYYRDEQGREIHSPLETQGYTSYPMAYPQLKIPGYQYVKQTPIPVLGLNEQNNRITLTYRPLPPVETQGTVISPVEPIRPPVPESSVHPNEQATGRVLIWTWETDHPLQSPKVLVGKVGDTYQVTAESLPGYQWIRAIGATSGKFTQTPQTVINVYRRAPFPINAFSRKPVVQRLPNRQPQLVPEVTTGADSDQKQGKQPTSSKNHQQERLPQNNENSRQNQIGILWGLTLFTGLIAWYRRPR